MQESGYIIPETPLNDMTILNSKYKDNDYYNVKHFEMSGDREVTESTKADINDKFIFKNGKAILNEKLLEWGTDRGLIYGAGFREVSYGDVIDVNSKDAETDKFGKYKNYLINVNEEFDAKVDLSSNNKEWTSNASEPGEYLYYEITAEGYKLLSYNNLKTRRLQLTGDESQNQVKFMVKEFFTNIPNKNLTFEMTKVPILGSSKYAWGEVRVSEKLSNGKTIYKNYDISVEFPTDKIESIEDGILIAQKLTSDGIPSSTAGLQHILEKSENNQWKLVNKGGTNPKTAFWIGSIARREYYYFGYYDMSSDKNINMDNASINGNWGVGSTPAEILVDSLEEEISVKISVNIGDIIKTRVSDVRVNKLGTYDSSGVFTEGEQQFADEKFAGYTYYEVTESGFKLLNFNRVEQYIYNSATSNYEKEEKLVPIISENTSDDEIQAGMMDFFPNYKSTNDGLIFEWVKMPNQNTDSYPTGTIRIKEQLSNGKYVNRDIEVQFKSGFQITENFIDVNGVAVKEAKVTKKIPGQTFTPGSPATTITYNGNKYIYKGYRLNDSSEVLTGKLSNINSNTKIYYVYETEYTVTEKFQSEDGTTLLSNKSSNNKQSEWYTSEPSDKLVHKNLNYTYLGYKYNSGNLITGKPENKFNQTAEITQVTNTSSMFAASESSKEIDLSSFDTKKVMTMRVLLSECRDLQKILLGNIDTSNVTTVAYIFDRCSSLKNIDISMLDLSNGETLEGGLMDVPHIKNWI
ncbi:TPA: BspA family leucine-rich repeat surface protein [Enterococcus faecalis]|nr:BspA family leucine-rich repeat surface protein [Enterococcus faecalis]